MAGAPVGGKRARERGWRCRASSISERKEAPDSSESPCLACHVEEVCRHVCRICFFTDKEVVRAPGSPAPLSIVVLIYLQTACKRGKYALYLSL